MTLLFEHSAEGSTDEADVVAAVSSFGSPWTTINKVGAATIKYDSAQAMHGSRSIRVERTATTDAGDLRYQHSAAMARMQARLYFRTDAVPSTAQLNLIVFRHAAGFMGYIGLTSAGRLQVYNTSNTGVSASLASAAIAANTWYRLEATIKKGAGTTDGLIEYAYYLGDSTTPISIWSAGSVSAVAGAHAGINTGTADPIQVRYGINGASTVPAMVWLDDAAIGDGATGFLGPSGGLLPTAVLDGELVHLIDARGSSSPSGGLNFSIAQNAGPSVTPSLILPGLWSVVPHATSSLVYEVTVDNVDGDDTEMYTVPSVAGGTVPVQDFLRVSGAWV